MRPPIVLRWVTGLLTIALALLLLLFNPGGLLPLLVGCLVVGGVLFGVAFVVGLIDKRRQEHLPGTREDKGARAMSQKPPDNAS